MLYFWSDIGHVLDQYKDRGEFGLVYCVCIKKVAADDKQLEYFYFIIVQQTNGLCCLLLCDFRGYQMGLMAWRPYKSGSWS